MKKPADYYESEPGTSEEYLARFAANRDDLKEAILYLIHRREMLRDAEIEVLEARVEELIKKVSETKKEMLLEELDCFREVIALHKRLLIEDEQPGD